MRKLFGKKGEATLEKQGPRYRVIDLHNKNREVKRAFVLCPEYDSAARTALATYGEATRNVKTARYIRMLLKEIHDERTGARGE